MLSRRKRRGQALVRSTTQVAGEWVAGAGDACASACAGSVALAGMEWVAGSAAFADWGCDSACLECGAERVAAVAAVGPDLVGLVAGLAERVDKR